MMALDFNAKISGREGSDRDEYIAVDLVVAGLEDIPAHFRPL